MDAATNFQPFADLGVCRAKKLVTGPILLFLSTLAVACLLAVDPLGSVAGGISSAPSEARVSRVLPITGYSDRAYVVSCDELGERESKVAVSCVEPAELPGRKALVITARP